MVPTNDFLPFCPTDTGTNLLSESDYTAAADRVSGNKPGVASSKLNNKALRQASAVAAGVAQFVTNRTLTNVLDDAISAKLLAQITSALTAYPPNITKYTSGSGNFDLTFIFGIATGSATIGATYTNNAVTFTVTETIASGVVLRASGSGAPAVSGTLTKASGTGDATITFYAYRQAVYLRAQLAGGGGGGGGSGTTSGTAATAGGNTTFGTTLLSAGGGGAGSRNGDGGSGGTSSLGTGPEGLALTGGQGGPAVSQSAAPACRIAGGLGGSSAFGGAGSGGSDGGTGNGIAAAANTGGGGGGAFVNLINGGQAGSGGGAGAYVDAMIKSPLATYSYAVGAAGSGQAAGTSGFTGGDGALGVIVIEEHYQ